MSLFIYPFVICETQCMCWSSNKVLVSHSSTLLRVSSFCIIAQQKHMMSIETHLHFKRSVHQLISDILVMSKVFFLATPLLPLI